MRIGPGSGSVSGTGTRSGSGSGTTLVFTLGLGLGRKKKFDNSNFDHQGGGGLEGTWRSRGNHAMHFTFVITYQIHNVPSIFFFLILNILHPLAQNVKRSLSMRKQSFVYMRQSISDMKKGFFLIFLI